MKYPIIITLIVTLLTGCASNNYKYKESFSAQSVGEDVWEVVFSVRGNVSMERARDLILLRCAELSLGNGFDYFAIQNSSEETKSNSLYFIFSKESNNDESSSDEARESKPMNHKIELVYTITGFDEKPGGSDDVYDANLVSSSMREKYGTSGTSEISL